MRYGYIENGYLKCKQIEEYVEKHKDDDGNIVTKTITVEEQIESLSSIWKPVDEIDESRLSCDDGYFVSIVPVDNGDYIGFDYPVNFDTNKIKTKISELKSSLDAEDYKITKCYEASLTKSALPYDIDNLHRERNAIRTEINELETLLINNQ